LYLSETYPAPDMAGAVTGVQLKKPLDL